MLQNEEKLNEVIKQKPHGIKISPKVKVCFDVLINHFKHFPDSQAIVFVKTRVQASILNQIVSELISHYSKAEQK